MIEKIKAFLSPQVVEKPRDWEEAVSNTYRVLDFQIHLAEIERRESNFNAQEHAKRIRGRIKNLKDLVLEHALKERSIFSYPEPFAVQTDRVYFYIPNVNKVILANDRGINGFISVPNLTTAVDVDELRWCLDKELVSSIAKELIQRLPQESSKRILSKTS